MSEKVVFAAEALSIYKVYLGDSLLLGTTGHSCRPAILLTMTSKCWTHACIYASSRMGFEE